MTTTQWSEQDWHTLATIVFRDDYPGYTPAITEAPNGDGAVDSQKRYAHVARKYLREYSANVPGASGRVAVLEHFLQKAYDLAERIAACHWVSRDMWPSLQHGALRVLEYPAGAGSALHTDMDLFTVNLWRSEPNEGLPPGSYHMGELGELLGVGPATPHAVHPVARVQRSLVYFAVPDHSATLPSWQSVGEWLDERMKRSRYSR